MKNIELDFYPEYQELIYDGKKTSTLRTDKQNEAVGLEKGESGLITIKDKQFTVTYTGLVGVDEVGGREHVWRTEGFLHLHISPKFHSTWMFLLGKRQLHHYTIFEHKEEKND